MHKPRNHFRARTRKSLSGEGARSRISRVTVLRVARNAGIAANYRNNGITGLIIARSRKRASGTLAVKLAMNKTHQVKAYAMVCGADNADRNRTFDISAISAVITRSSTCLSI